MQVPQSSVRFAGGTSGSARRRYSGSLLGTE